MLQRRVRQPPHSRCQSRALQTHLRELVAQSSHGRPARSLTEPEWRQFPRLHTKMWQKVCHRVMARDIDQSRKGEAPARGRPMCAMPLWECVNGPELACQPDQSNQILLIK